MRHNEDKAEGEAGEVSPPLHVDLPPLRSADMVLGAERPARKAPGPRPTRGYLDRNFPHPLTPPTPGDTSRRCHTKIVYVRDPSLVPLRPTILGALMDPRMWAKTFIRSPVHRPSDNQSPDFTHEAQLTFHQEAVCVCVCVCACVCARVCARARVWWGAGVIEGWVSAASWEV